MNSITTIISTGVIFLALTVSCAKTETAGNNDTNMVGDILRDAAGFPHSNSEFLSTIGAYENALEEQTAVCMRSSGFEYIPRIDSDDKQIEALGFDLSQKQYANELGFGIANGTIEGFTTTDNSNFEYQASLSEDQLTEYQVTLYGDSFDQLQTETKGNGCQQRASEIVTKPSWFINLDWSYMVSDELSQRLDSDPRIILLDSAWFKCMVESGYDNWSREEELVDSLNQEMVEITRTLIPLTPAFNTGEDFLKSLSKISRETFETFRSKEIRLAVASHTCNARHQDQFISISQEIEKSILESNPPAQIHQNLN